MLVPFAVTGGLPAKADPITTANSTDLDGTANERKKQYKQKSNAISAQNRTCHKETRYWGAMEQKTGLRVSDGLIQ